MQFEWKHGQLPGSLELAYLGDTLYDLYVRSHLVQHGGRVSELHRRATGFVNAHAQSEALKNIEGLLTEQEADAVRRGRNVKQSPPRHADRAEYCRATGLEALFGWLYARGETERMWQLMEAALPPERFEAAE